jgi:hypothetical protein
MSFVDSRQRDERMSVAQRRLTLAECLEALQILQSFLLMIRSEWFGPPSAFSKVRDSWARYVGILDPPLARCARTVHNA